MSRYARRGGVERTTEEIAAAIRRTPWYKSRRQTIEDWDRTRISSIIDIVSEPYYLSVLIDVLERTGFHDEEFADGPQDLLDESKALIKHVAKLTRVERISRAMLNHGDQEPVPDAYDCDCARAREWREHLRSALKP